MTSTEGQNLNLRKEHPIVLLTLVIENRAEKLKSQSESIGRNPGVKP